jgi:hypothetical protein
MTLPKLLFLVAMLALTACASKRAETPEVGTHTEGGAGMGGM